MGFFRTEGPVFMVTEVSMVCVGEERSTEDNVVRKVSVAAHCNMATRHL